MRGIILVNSSTRAVIICVTWSLRGLQAAQKKIHQFERQVALLYNIARELESAFADRVASEEMRVQANRA